MAETVGWLRYLTEVFVQVKEVEGHVSATPEIEINEASLEAAANEAIAAFDAATTLEELQEARRGHLGDKSFISQARQSLGQHGARQSRKALRSGQ